jgi:ectoine hydroxylase-related dioxygenase (phytanoyl-CoA dioxygenase family)
MGAQAEPVSARCYPAALAEKIDALGLWDNFRDLERDGYTIIQDETAHALTDSVREAILRLARASGDHTSRGAALLLGRDPVFERAVLVPKLLALVEVLLGRGALLSQLTGSIRSNGSPALGLHADNSWFPEPFPTWEIACTACWVTDEFTLEGGATVVIPGTHKLKMHPPKIIRETRVGERAIVAPKGSIVLWDASVWHGNAARVIDGERVVLHMTYCRIGIQPVENYHHLDDQWLASRAPELSRLLGRDVFFGSTTIDSGGVDRGLLTKTFQQVHEPDVL